MTCVSALQYASQALEHTNYETDIIALEIDICGKKSIVLKIYKSSDRQGVTHIFESLFINRDNYVQKLGNMTFVD